MIKTYDPTLVTVTWGPYEFQGFMDGTSIEVDYNADASTLHMGLKGTATRIKSADQSGRFTITLAQGSSTNTDLAAAHAADRLPGANVKYPMTVADAAGAAIKAFGAQAWIVKSPKLERGKDLSPAVWIFETDALKLNVAGND